MNGDTNSIKNWAVEDRPREKMMEKGEQALSNSELLAILIGSGTTKKSAVELMQDVMKQCNGRFAQLSRMSLDELTSFPGIGPAKAVTLKAAAEIARRRTLESTDDITIISNAEVAYRLMHPIVRDLPHEEFWVLLLNNNSGLIRKERLSTGGLTATAVDVRLVLKKALLADATQMIVCHNHPSGSCRPSNDDIALTDRIKDAAQTMRIRLVDHIILTDGHYYSFQQEGRL